MAEIPIYHIQVESPEIPSTAGAAQNQFELQFGKTTIGRVPGNTIVLAHPLVSRSHAHIEIATGSCLLIDLGSANGTSQNGKRLQPNVPEILLDGAKITIGPFDLHFKIHTPDEPEIVQEYQPAHPSEEPAAVSQGAQNLPGADLADRMQTEPIVQADESDSEGVEISRIFAPAGQNAASQVANSGEPPLPPPPHKPHTHTGEPEDLSLPPGLDYTSQKLINYLPGIYHTDFMSRFLALFESILTPIEWNIDNFDLYLDPGTAPESFLPWLANWYQVGFDSTWSEAQRRSLLSEARNLYARRGTKWALTRLLEIYTGRTPEIIEFDKNLAPYTFIVRLPMRAGEVNPELITRLIDANKPAYTNYALEFFR